MNNGYGSSGSECYVRRLALAEEKRINDYTKDIIYRLKQAADNDKRKGDGINSLLKENHQFVQGIEFACKNSSRYNSGTGSTAALINILHEDGLSPTEKAYFIWGNSYASLVDGKKIKLTKLLLNRCKKLGMFDTTDYSIFKRVKKHSRKIRKEMKNPNAKT
ncbi:MAG: hypothetical protein KAW40_05780 [Candidatus Aenigmarchaeota archaeon]|nr:hypothetical protein [Candidatus Aenigmarchaeota archaeon]